MHLGGLPAVVVVAAQEEKGVRCPVLLVHSRGMTDPDPDLNIALETAAQDLSDMWLMQAFLQLVESLGMTARGSLGSVISGRGDEQPGLGYFMTRLNGSRKAVAFAAFAAEAYINRLLHNRLSGQDMATALKLRPVIEKFAFAAQLALGQPLIQRDEVLYRELKELFGLRNRLVHATPRAVEPGDVLGEAAFAECNPLVAQRFVAASARTARLVLVALDPPASTVNVDQVIEIVERLRPLAEQAAATLPPTPAQVMAEIETARQAHPEFF